MELVRRTDAERKAYFEGVEQGIRLYAHWRDGVQYVGTCGEPLAQALERVRALAMNEKTIEQCDFYGEDY